MTQCDCAVDYINFVKQQRVGPVTIDMERSRGDFTGYTVPGDCIGFVMGRNGQTLRNMEEEWGVLMFFVKDGGGLRILPAARGPGAMPPPPPPSLTKTI